jgi:nucleoside-diphosphate-sugar epimerase
MKLGTDLVSIEYHPLPSDDPTRRKPNIDKAKSLLGWEPHVSFAQGLEKTIEYFQEVELNIGS